MLYTARWDEAKMRVMGKLRTTLWALVSPYSIYRQWPLLLGVIILHIYSLDDERIKAKGGVHYNTAENAIIVAPAAPDEVAVQHHTHTHTSAAFMAQIDRIYIYSRHKTHMCYMLETRCVHMWRSEHGVCGIGMRQERKVRATAPLSPLPDLNLDNHQYVLARLEWGYIYMHVRAQINSLDL